MLTYAGGGRAYERCELQHSSETGDCDRKAFGSTEHAQGNMRWGRYGPRHEILLKFSRDEAVVLLIVLCVCVCERERAFSWRAGAHARKYKAG